MRKISLRIPPELETALAHRIQATGQTQTAVVQEALRAHLLAIEASLDDRVDQLERDIDELKRLAQQLS